MGSACIVMCLKIWTGMSGDDLEVKLVSVFNVKVDFVCQFRKLMCIFHDF